MLKLLAMAAMLSSQAAGAPPTPERCLTRQQVGDLTVIGVAMSVETVRNACRAHLPPTAYLATPAAAEFSARLRAEGRQRLDSGMAGIREIVGDSQGPAMAGMMRAFSEGLMTEGAGADFSRYATPELCRDANEIVEISAALTPDQMGRLAAAFASIADHFVRMAPPQPPLPAPAANSHRRSRRDAPPEVAPPPSPPIPPFLCREGE